MAENKLNQSQLHDHINDPYVKLAQRGNYRTHATCELKKIDEQDELIKPSQVTVDLGAAPGSWNQYVRNELTASPHVKDGRVGRTIAAADILSMEAIADVIFIQGDFRENDVFRQLEEIVLEVIGGGKVDLVLSNMAPNFSGVASADAARMEHVAELAVKSAITHLKPKGALLIKCLHGNDYSQTVEMFERHFKVMTPRKPKASRDKPPETLLLDRQLRHSGWQTIFRKGSPAGTTIRRSCGQSTRGGVRALRC